MANKSWRKKSHLKETAISNKFEHIMIDLETLSSRHDALILSIGAVAFNEEEIFEPGFYAAISIDSQVEKYGRHISDDTVAWWGKQSPEARKVLTDKKAIELPKALKALSEYLRDVAEPKIWGYGRPSTT